jgi:hypothetical protein
MDNRCSISFTVVYYQVVTRSDYVIADYVAFQNLFAQQLRINCYN